MTREGTSMKHTPCFLSLLVLAGFLLLAIGPPVTQAQKKRKDAAPAAQSAVTEQSPRGTGHAGSTIREVLTKLQGQQTNIGVVVRVTGDIVEFENEGETLIYSLNAVQVVKFLKADEGETRKVEIKFLARD
jgi:hypothetical protein